MVQDHVVRDLAGPVAGAVHRVVDQDVQPAQSVDGFTHQVHDVVGHRHVGADRYDTRAGGVTDFGGGRPQVILPSRADGYGATVPGQRVSDGFADALAPAGYQRGLAFQSWQHDSLL